MVLRSIPTLRQRSWSALTAMETPIFRLRSSHSLTGRWSLASSTTNGGAACRGTDFVFLWLASLCRPNRTTCYTSCTLALLADRASSAFVKSRRAIESKIDKFVFDRHFHWTDASELWRVNLWEVDWAPISEVVSTPLSLIELWKWPGWHCCSFCRDRRVWTKTISPVCLTAGQA